MAAGLSRTVLQMKLEQKLNSQSDLTGANIIAKTKSWTFNIIIDDPFLEILMLFQIYFSILNFQMKS